MKFKIVKKKTQSDRAKKAHVLARELNLTDEERYELARMIPGVPESGSWKLLNELQYHDLITMMEGFLLITYLYSQRS